ncbi:hypothetical protein HPC50_22105 [Corallococcus exiguus]|uniref:ComEC/Rec2 family competence protein n=1 Tax=Corallococcus TaxID=83461 RepID=UPI0011C38B1D|nr:MULTISPECIES: hypothetical protein [Corallococcus]NPC49759.1 hypothetical protein [Corallococcus exiguus]
MATLETAAPLKRNDVVLWPWEVGDCSNDNSTAKIFRKGRFAVLSLGDLEDPAIARKIMLGNIVRAEVDVMILAHHGAANGFTSREFLEAVKPRVAICSSNYDNQYEHPDQEIRDLLFEMDIDLFTTKTGDVVIESLDETRNTYRVTNYIAGGEEVSSVRDYQSKTW